MVVGAGDADWGRGGSLRARVCRDRWAAFGIWLYPRWGDVPDTGRKRGYAGIFLSSRHYFRDYGTLDWAFPGDALAGFFCSTNFSNNACD